jgi:hypothetical protein
MDLCCKYWTQIWFTTCQITIKPKDNYLHYTRKSVISQTDRSEQGWAYQITSRQTRSSSYDVIDDVIKIIGSSLMKHPKESTTFDYST